MSLDPRIARLRAIAAEAARRDASEWDDEPPTTPGMLPPPRLRLASQPEGAVPQTVGAVERLLGAVRGPVQLLALVALLLAALMAFYLWRVNG